MHYLRFIFLLSICCTVRNTGLAQNTGYSQEIFGTRDGLLSSKIFTLTQTSDRMLWIGTELGASVYNGYEFINYQYTSANKAVGRILSIAEDSAHGIWLGGNNGLFYLHNGKLQQLLLRNNRVSLAVESLLTDAVGNVWIGDQNGLYQLTPPLIDQIRLDPTRSMDLSLFAGFKDRAYSIAADNQRNIYIGSHDGVFKISANGHRYEMIWQNPDPIRHVQSVAALSPDSIYWNCVEQHPVQMIRGRTTSYFTNDYNGSRVFTSRHKAYGLTTNGVIAIEEKIRPLLSFTATLNFASAAIVDLENNIWVGSWEGLQKFRQTSFQQYQLQDDIHKEAFSFMERKNGDLLFGGNRGRLFIKKDNAIMPLPGVPRLFRTAEIMCMYEDQNGGIWAGSGYNGISHLVHNRLRNWMDTGFMRDNNCEALFPTTDGKLMACTEQGVTVLDPLAKDPLVAHYPFREKYARFPELFGCLQLGTDYWFYGNQGLYILRNNQLIDDSIEGMSIKNLYINKIVSDRKGNIWIATLGKGVLKCRYENGRISLVQQYDQKKGAPSDVALALLVDRHDQVWWGDYMSVSMLANNNFNEQLVSFNESDGLLNSYYQTLKLEQEKNGTIWGMTSMGVFSFDPDNIHSNRLAPTILLEEVMINGNDKNYSTTQHPQLFYNNNSIRFHYTAVSLTDPARIRYAYRLKEIDSTWQYSNSRTAVFNFLPPGKYTFELIASNNNNTWTNLPLQYHFTIHPPFWQTWWFRSLLVLLIGSLIFIIFRRRVILIKNKATIKQQMAELEAKAIRAQMNPHFIFNSLNAIQESIVMNDFNTSYQYLSKFSKLLRQVLNNSEKNFISLRDEIDMNRLYLELESLRFKHSFSYAIDIDELIDADTLLFPSLMLQPFLENAIWHGLMQKEGEKKLLVSFTIREQQLECIIEDNGIGREKAAAIKKQKLGSQYFESKGTALAMQRLLLLKESGATNVQLIMEDLKDAQGAATGTRVVIQIPLMTLNETSSL